MSKFPLSIEIPYQDPAELFSIFSDDPWSFLLDSANANEPMEDTNRYSYIAVDPFEKILIKNKRDQEFHSIVCPFEHLKKILSAYEAETDPNLPPFQGGILGYFSYDLCHYLESIPSPKQSENTSYQDLAVGIFDLVIAFDHMLKKAFVVSTGFPEQNDPERLMRAKMRLDVLKNKLTKETRSVQSDYLSQQKSDVDLKSPFNEQAYANIVKQAQEYILEGDIFEVNLSHRFEASFRDALAKSYGLYLSMRQQNPSPFSAYLNFGDHKILSSSPERFLLLDSQRKVSTRPIKGTISRGQTPEEDKINAETLAQSEKDCSENVMIADLLRNDLSKVCSQRSVKVKKLCGLETYPTVHHLVTVIEGELKPAYDAIDLLKACFPGGSIIGAPKVRAMQIIYELEPTARGPYCGSIGYIGFNGTMDTSIVIRTVLVQDEKMSYQAGGAVVLDSSPEGEYEETLVKSFAIKKTLKMKEPA